MNTLLQDLLEEFQKKLMTFHCIPRDQQWPPVFNKIKVAIGMRRVGKTYFLFMKLIFWHLIP